jgi:hypothetical protein
MHPSVSQADRATLSEPVEVNPEITCPDEADRFQAQRSDRQRLRSVQRFSFVGKSLLYFSTHMDLVKKMKEAKRHKAGEAARDNEWAQKDITEAKLTSD